MLRVLDTLTNQEVLGHQHHTARTHATRHRWHLAAWMSEEVSRARHGVAGAYNSRVPA